MRNTIYIGDFKLTQSIREGCIRITSSSEYFPPIMLRVGSEGLIFLPDEDMGLIIGVDSLDC